MIKIIAYRLQQEIIFTVALALAVITSFLALPKLHYLDWEVLICLFNLMLVLQAFEELKVLDKASIHILSKYGNMRSLSFVLILITFFSAMLITNDVALITFVPIALIIARKADFDPMYLIILQTLAANIGSSLTPMGNPQNLFLFSYYHIPISAFLLKTFFFVCLGALWLLLLNLRLPVKPLIFQLSPIEMGSGKKVILYFGLFFIIILSILHLISYWFALGITLLIILTFDRGLILKVDYFLLATFICFFIFIGNLANLPKVAAFIHGVLNSQAKSYSVSILLSQFISNVPCAILLASFTKHWDAVLLGVNIGGMGTLIASLASVISYKFYAKTYNGKAYLIKFHLINFASLAVFSGLFYLFL